MQAGDSDDEARTDWSLRAKGIPVMRPCVDRRVKNNIEWSLFGRYEGQSVKTGCFFFSYAGMGVAEGRRRRRLPDAPHGRWLNLFFVFYGSLTEGLNALRLNDALPQGFWRTKNKFFTPAAKAPLTGSLRRLTILHVFYSTVCWFGDAGSCRGWMWGFFARAPHIAREVRKGSWGWRRLLRSASLWECQGK